MHNREYFDKDKIDIDKYIEKMLLYLCQGFGKHRLLKLFPFNWEKPIDKKSSGVYNTLALARVLEWQTSTFEVRVVSPCGFESHLSHQNIGYPYG